MQVSKNSLLTDQLAAWEDQFNGCAAADQCQDDALLISRCNCCFMSTGIAPVKQWRTVPLMGATSVENWCSARTNNVRPAQPTYARSQPSSMVPALHRSLCNCRQASLAGISTAALLIQADPTTSTTGWPPANVIYWSCR